jgi:hypothetical protein
VINEDETPVFPGELRSYLGNLSATTLRDQMRAKRIPPFDKVITQKTRYWHRSTLERAGLLPPRQASANPPTPASSDAAQA